MKLSLMKTNLKQIFCFLVVGTLSFIIDYSILFALTEFVGIFYLLAAAIAFLISVIFNFYLSMRFVFDAKNMNLKEQFIIFITTSLLGLALNEVGLLVLVEDAGIDYKIAKLIMTVIVMVFNFTARKILFEKR
jgi:hypothetical protein